MGAVSSVSACCTPCCSCFYYNSFDYLCRSCSSLSCCFNTCKSFFVPFFFFARSHHHIIAWVSKVAFIISGSSWACNFVLLLCCQKPSSCICRIQYASFSCYSWCCSLSCYCSHILRSLSTNNLTYSWVGNLIDTWSTSSTSVLWTVSSTMISWKPLYLCC